MDFVELRCAQPRQDQAGRAVFFTSRATFPSCHWPFSGGGGDTLGVPAHGGICYRISNCICYLWLSNRYRLLYPLKSGKVVYLFSGVSTQEPTVFDGAGPSYRQCPYATARL
jgi:hypothetical protein